MATKRDYYEVLGVNKDADEDAIKKAYRRLAMKFHPDRNAGDKGAEEKFKEAKEAYEMLSDEQKRAAYDRYGHAGVDPSAGAGAAGGAGFGSFADAFGERGFVGVLKRLHRVLARHFAPRAQVGCVAMPQRECVTILLQQELVGAGKGVGQRAAHGLLGGSRCWRRRGRCFSLAIAIGRCFGAWRWGWRQHG